MPIRRPNFPKKTQSVNKSESATTEKEGKAPLKRKASNGTPRTRGTIRRGSKEDVIESESNDKDNETAPTKEEEANTEGESGGDEVKEGEKTQNDDEQQEVEDEEKITEKNGKRANDEMDEEDEIDDSKKKEDSTNEETDGKPKATKRKKASNKKSTEAETLSESTKSYKNLIKDAIRDLNERKGSSRMALKKHLKSQNPNFETTTNFDHFFNSALKKGVDGGEFIQPKGPSGTVMLPKPAGKVTKSKTPKSTNDSKSTKEHKSKVTKPKSTTNKKTSMNKKVEKPKTKPKRPTSKGSNGGSQSDAPSYKEMIMKSLSDLNDGKGASRNTLKKFVKGNFDSINPTRFDYLFNSTIKKCVDSGELLMPKGPLGTVKFPKSKKTAKSG
ncbi:histone H1/H5 family protein NDAI_0E01510 [Naumovozyma dairenensis CBS 421]|uniref:Histone H1 n=1 Tax=Naumovozyma dairenensis (strain ATCC 10597 / BCRC 20456 / CBS 421 / NBRC 0211 / NRRL Y-12639) TaxID=1071378 RepID=G0WB47_NAUDC|nr:hypothetical protein NDAI_0E01510 [Naumovozyma dairenensis CBS 421]CCD24967.1 hypothetical protein NDAI_0E01510 [Naumovozyma dairenensis CBS 421]